MNKLSVNMKLRNLLWICANVYVFCCSETFEAENNTVELRLHLAPSYRLLNGALQPMNKEEDESVALTFDRRKTVGELRLAIYQVIPGLELSCL